MKNLLFCLIVLLILSPVAIDASEKDEVLQTSRQYFGEPIDAVHNLYEVNRFYVFRIDFDKRERVEEMAVEPKYYFTESHPDWEETDDFKPLSFTEYKSLLGWLDNIKTKGNLISEAQIGIVGNATAFYKHKYERAWLEIGYVFSLDADENTPAEINFFRVSFRKDSEQKIEIKPLTKS